jgi:hypothetical protein
MINSFVMNTMEFKSASLDIIDFNHGLLIGMFEGVVSPTKMNEIALNSMKVLRRKIWDKGQGPA